MSERIWDKFLTDKDKRIFQLAGYGKRGGFGTRPALFIIDVQYNFTGDEPGDGERQRLQVVGEEAGDREGAQRT